MPKKTKNSKLNGLNKANDTAARSFIKKELPSEDGAVSDKISGHVKKRRIKLKKKAGKNNKKRERGKGASVNGSRIDEQITEIYENDDGSMPDMSHFQRTKKSRFVRAFTVLFAACLFLAAVIWAGFFVFTPPSKFSENDVVLSISGNEEARAGEEVRYRIRYRNAQQTPLENVLLQIRYPDGFVFEDSSVKPKNEANNEWLIGSLEEEGSGYIDIFGRMYGDKGGRQSFRVFLNYTPRNFSSKFQKATNISIEISDAPVDLFVEGPDEVIYGGDIVLNITVDKELEARLDNIAVEIDGGGIFTVKDASPPADQFADNRWSIEALDGNYNLSVTGVFDSGIQESQGKVVVKLIGWKNEDRSGNGYVYDSKEYTVNFLHTDLSANLVINGTAEDMSVQPGESLSSSIILKNAGDTPIKNVVVRAIFDAPSVGRRSILNWSKIDDPADGDIIGEQLNTERRRGTITWDRGDVLDLRQLDPDEELIIDFRLPIKDANDVDLTEYSTSEINAALEIKYRLGGEDQILSTTPMVMTINSDADLEVRDNVVNENTHNITWLLTNSFHELENIVIAADLYGDIILVNDLEAPAGKVSYDKDSQKLVWEIDKMPVSLDVLALPFTVVINKENPTQTNLTSKVSFEAVDTITGEKIMKVGDEILLKD